MNRKKVLIVLGIIGSLAIICMIVAIYWAINNPEINTAFNKFRASMNAMTELQEKIISAYPADSVRVSFMNGHILSISLVNSDANKLSSDEQGERAKEIAQFSKENYARMDGIDTIQIALVQQGGAFGMSYNFKRNYGFNIDQLT